MVAVGYGRNGEKYHYTTLAGKILEYLALPHTQRPSRAIFEEELFPSDGEAPPRDFDKDDTFSRRLVTTQFENLYTHRNLWNGIDIVGWRRSTRWTPEHKRYVFYAVEVKARVRREWKLRGEHTKIKVKEKQPGNMLRELSELQEEVRSGKMTTYRDGVPTTITQAKGYFGISYFLRQQNNEEDPFTKPIPQSLFLLNPAQITHNEKGESRFVVPQSHEKNPYRNYKHHLFMISNGRSLVENGDLTERELPKSTQTIWPGFQLFGPRGVILPTFANAFQDPIAQEYEGVENLEERLQRGEEGHHENDCEHTYTPVEVEPGVWF